MRRACVCIFHSCPLSAGANSLHHEPHSSGCKNHEGLQETPGGKKEAFSHKSYPITVHEQCQDSKEYVNVIKGCDERQLIWICTQ